MANLQNSVFIVQIYYKTKSFLRGNQQSESVFPGEDLSTNKTIPCNNVQWFKETGS